MLSLSFCATRSVRFGRRRHRIRGLTIDPRGSIDGGKEKNKGGGRVVFVTEDVIAQEAQGRRLLFCHSLIAWNSMLSMRAASSSPWVALSRRSVAFSGNRISIRQTP